MKEMQFVFTSSFILPTSSFRVRPPSRSGYCLVTSFLDDRERAPNARPLEIFSRARGVRVYLPLQFLDGREPALVAQATEEADAHHVAVQIPAPIHYEGLDGRFPRALERRAHADVRHAPPPSAVNQSRRHVDAAARNDAVRGPKVRRRESDCSPAFSAAHDAPLDAVGTAQHSAREVDSPLREQLSDAARTDALVAQTHFGNFVGEEAQLAAHLPQKLYVPLAPATEREAATEVDLLRVQTFVHHVSQELSGAHARELAREAYDYRLLDAEHAEGFYLLVECLQQWRR